MKYNNEVNSGKLDEYGDFDDVNIPYRGDSALMDGADHSVDLVGGYYQGKTKQPRYKIILGFDKFSLEL